MIKAIDYYTRRYLNPDGTSLRLFQYEPESEVIYSDGVKYTLYVRYIGLDPLFCVTIFDGSGASLETYVSEDIDVEELHSMCVSGLKAFIKQKAA